MTFLAVLFIGFSVISVVLLVLTHFRESKYGEQPGARTLGLILVFSLGALQLAHGGWLYYDRPWVTSVPYQTLLYVVAPTFWGFGRCLLRPDQPSEFRPIHFVHALPSLIAPWLRYGVALPMAFLVGSAYLVALAIDVYHLRDQRDQYTREIQLLGWIFIIALAVAVLSMVQEQLPDKLFFTLYSIAIGLAFLLVQIALGLRPRLAEEVTQTAKSAYVNSTLTHVDRQAELGRLELLMHGERLYQDPNLNLQKLAHRLGLSGHQLSELINASLCKSFSRYLREQRVEAAKTMLSAEPSASVLSVGLSVGFNTQSNFYDAFREIEGMTPGQYRKLHVEGEAGATANS